MSPRRMKLPAFGLLIALLFVALLSPATLLAQDTPTPAPTPAPATVTSTPAPTNTPAPTPTATPTFTALQTQLALGQAYLDGKDFARAAAIFAAVVEADRGNPAALAGLKAALDGQAAAHATAAAPVVTPAPTEPPAAAPPSAAATIRAKLLDYASTALGGLLVVVLVYLAAAVLRWLLYWLREVWLLRVLPLFKRPAVAPGFLIGDFSNGLGADGANVPGIVTQALSEKLVQWNQLVHAKEVPVQPEATLDLGGMGWLKILWSWVLPPARGYKLTGALLQDAKGAYQLSIQRTDLAHNRVDMSTTLARRGASPEDAFQKLAGEAAKWLVSPADMAASDAMLRGMRSLREVGADAALLTPSEIFDEALNLLLPVRQQVNLGAIDFAFARKQLTDAEGLLLQLPAGSSLRSDLSGVIADLRRAVPASG